MQTLHSLFVSMRPKQWVKNLFVFAALLFVKAFDDPEKILLTIEAFILFSLVSSAVYLVNDVVDRKGDRLHPTKRNRPIAAGKLSSSVAVLAAVIFSAASLTVSFYIDLWFGIVVLLYATLNLMYSFLLKRLVILDVGAIALGFVLRVVGGAAVIAVPVSVWIILCTFFLTFFLAVNKRKRELSLYGSTGTREVLTSYTTDFLELLSTVSLSTVIITYTFYTFSTQHSRLLMLTVPIVLYGLFYYIHALSRNKEEDADPTDVVLRERNLQITILVWVVVSLAILYLAS